MSGTRTLANSLLRDFEVLDLGESSTNTLIKQYCLKINFKYFSLYPQISVVFTYHQRNFSLQKRETITKKIEVVESSHNRYIYKTTPTCKAPGTLQKR